MHTYVNTCIYIYVCMCKHRFKSYMRLHTSVDQKLHLLWAQLTSRVMMNVKHNIMQAVQGEKHLSVRQQYHMWTEISLHKLYQTKLDCSSKNSWANVSLTSYEFTFASKMMCHLCPTVWIMFLFLSVQWRCTAGLYCHIFCSWSSPSI